MRHRIALASGILLVLSLSTNVVPAQPPTPKDDDELRAHFLDIGAGSCQVIECPGTPATTHPLIVEHSHKGGLVTVSAHFFRRE